MVGYMTRQDIALFNQEINRDLETRGLRRRLRARIDEAQRCYSEFGFLDDAVNRRIRMLDRVRDLKAQLAEIE